MSIKVLPSMEHTFSISVKGSDTGRQFDGSFTYRRPTLGTKSEISKTVARLNGDLANLDSDTRFMHEMLASLRHNLKECPDWWKNSGYGLELYDVNVIIELWKTCEEFEKKWRDQVWGEEPKESETKSA